MSVNFLISLYSLVIYLCSYILSCKNYISRFSKYTNAVSIVWRVYDWKLINKEIRSPKKRQVVCRIVLCVKPGILSLLLFAHLAILLSIGIRTNSSIRMMVVNFTFEWFYCFSDYECNLIRENLCGWTRNWRNFFRKGIRWA